MDALPVPVPEGPGTMDMERSPSPVFSKPASEPDCESEPESQQTDPDHAAMMCDVLEPPPRAPEPYNPEDPAQNTYDLVKARFELANFKVEIPFCYARVPDGTKRPEMYEETKTKQFWRALKYYQLDPETTKWAKLKFIERWLDDEKKRTVLALVVDPDNKEKGNVYNMWPGFRAEKLPPVDPALVEELSQPFVRHIHEVFSNNDSTITKWLLAWFAHMIQFPGTRTNVAVSLFGDEGCGKGIIPAFLRLMVMGPNCTFQTSNPEEDVFGKFGKAMVGSILLQLDEVTRVGVSKTSERLKDYVTNETVNYQAKHKDTITLNNYTNFIFTSNNEHTVTPSQTDRRFVLLKCSSIHRGNYSYFQDLSDHFKRDDVVSAVFAMLKGIDVTGIKNFQQNRPITEYYRDIQLAGMPMVPRYLSALCNAATIPAEMSSKEMFEQCSRYAEAGRFSFYLNSNTFGKRVKEILGEKAVHRRTAGIFYKINQADIKRRLEIVNLYDPDSFLITSSSTHRQGVDCQEESGDVMAITYHVPVV